MPNHPDIPDITALQHPLPQSRKRIRPSTVLLLWTLLLNLLPLNIWMAYSFSAPVLLEAYFFLFRAAMKGLATGIMCAGIILPPTSLAYWVWEALHEEIVV